MCPLGLYCALTNKKLILFLDSKTFPQSSSVPSIPCDLLERCKIYHFSSSPSLSSISIYSQKSFFNAIVRGWIKLPTYFSGTFQTLLLQFLLFEVTHGSCTMVPRIQKRCQELGVEIEEFSQFLTNYSKASSWQ